MNQLVIDRILSCAEQLDGVFTLPDLRVLFYRNSDIAIYKRLEVLVREGSLVKIKPGIYALPTASLVAISQRLLPRSYISTGTVLAEALVIGSIPARRVQAVKVGRPRVYRSSMGIIEHLSIKPGLFFGYESRNGALYATPEKAFLDVCYFLSKGRRFSFDPLEDVNLDVLDRARLDEYLKRYDRKFISFFMQRWTL